jgi:excisionase family DNA binding protein
MSQFQQQVERLATATEQAKGRSCQLTDPSTKGNVVIGQNMSNCSDSGSSERSVERLLLRPREAAKALGICERTLWDMTSKRELPRVRIGRAVRYDPRDLQAWINAQKNRID